MAQVTETFAAGNEEVTAALSVELPTGGAVPLSGNVSGTYGDAFIAGDINLVGDLFIEGLLTGVDTFHCQGNGFSVFFQNGGRAELHGKVKARWGSWGTDSTGWVVGDRIAVAPTKVGSYVPTILNWTGSWGTMVRPLNSLDVTLVDRIATPEVANLSQSIVFENLARGWHIHDSGGIFDVSDIKVLNSGTTGVLSNYPIHFHQVGDNSRGSLFERVVVEGGKNHAFVPHGSHGIVLQDCVAYKTINDAYWWDPPPTTPSGQPIDTSNDSHDVHWLHCLALDVVQTPGASTDHRLTAFAIGAGNGNRCIDSVASCVRGPGINISGFLWRENFVWEFVGCVAHNVQKNGIYTWTNSPHRHPIEDFVAYHFGRAGIEHGAYRNQFIYRDCSLTVTNPIFSFSSSDTQAIRQHANSGGQGLLFENIVTDDRLVVDNHGLAQQLPTIHRNCHYSKVYYTENDGTVQVPSTIKFEDCGLAPADFLLSGIVATSVIEIYEGGGLAHRWAGGWT